MGGILEGKEMEGKVGDVGQYSVDVEKSGKITIAVSVEAPFLDGAGKAKSENSVELELFIVLEKIAAKNGQPWLSSSIEGIKNILGIVG